MSTCKDCLHYEACCYWLSKEKKHLNCDEGFICDNFTARSEWVHLPCKVGDKVYYLWKNCGSGVWDIQETSVYSIMLFDDGVKIYISPSCGFTKNEKRLFFTREEAEKALEEKK